jgi:hypothetical protein
LKKNILRFLYNYSMGNTVAKNTATQSINSTIGVSTTQIANCATAVNDAQNLSFSANGPGSVCNITDTTIKETVAYQIDAQCFTSQSASTSISSQIAQNAVQQAKAVSQNLDLNPATTSAENLVNQLTTSAISVSSLNFSSCLESITQSQNISCSATNGGTVNLKNVYIGLEGITNALNECVFSQSSTTQVAQTIQNTLSESASATVKDALFWVLLAVALILFMVFLITFEIGWPLIIVLIVGLLIGTYLTIARFRYWWPFSRPPPTLPNILSNGTTLAGTPLTYPFAATAGTYQFVFNFKQPTTPQTFSLNVGTYSANLTIFPGITQIATNPIILPAGSETLKLSLTSAGPIDFIKIQGIKPGSPISIGSGTTNLTTTSTNITSTTPTSFLVSVPSTGGSYIITLNKVIPTSQGIAPNVYILVDPGTSTGAISGNPPTTGFGYFSALPAPTTPPAASVTITTTPLTLNAGSTHNIYISVDNGSINFQSATIAPS